jgi:hypothetical protein
MSPEDIRQFADDALALRTLLILARRDPGLTPEERHEYDALSQVCTGCLVLTDDMLRDTPQE